MIADNQLWVEWRLYTFTNVYISSIQKGIQTAHVVSDLFAKYSNKNYCLNEWASNHKTIIVLNGGNQSMLEQTFRDMEAFAEKGNYPFVMFKEDTQSLNGAVTAIGIVLPSEIYNLQKLYRNEDGSIDEAKLDYVKRCIDQTPFLDTLFKASLAI